MEDLTEITKELQNFLDDGGRLTAFPAKRKKQLMAIKYLSTKFQPDTLYSEQDIKDILGSWTLFSDAATLRRELYDGKYLNRERSGKTYWVEPAPKA